MLNLSSKTVATFTPIALYSMILVACKVFGLQLPVLFTLNVTATLPENGLGEMLSTTTPQLQILLGSNTTVALAVPVHSLESVTVTV